MSPNIQFLPLSLIFLYRRRQAVLLPSLPTTSFRLCRSRHISVHHSTINVRRLKAFSQHQDFQQPSLTRAFPTNLRSRSLFSASRHQGDTSSYTLWILPTIFIRSLRTSTRQQSSAAIRILFEVEDDIELSQDISSLREHVAITTFINRGPSSSCLLKHIHPRTLTPSTTFDFETLKIAGVCQRKFFLSFQSFAFYADADSGPTPVEPTRLPDIHIRVRSLIT